MEESTYVNQIAVRKIVCASTGCVCICANSAIFAILAAAAKIERQRIIDMQNLRRNGMRTLHIMYAGTAVKIRSVRLFRAI